jgi:NitT/TauT family transport system permease protein
MSFVGVPTRYVRAALKRPIALGPDLILLGLMLSIFGALLMVGRQMTAPLREQVEIDLSYWSLPKYTVLSLGRGFAAYFLSLVFTLVYGSAAAHNPRAEKLMIPALDVLQAIPVLGFLPGVVLALVALSPAREFGLEIASIVMIFTGQVWNMTFSFHGSLRAIPQSFREVAAIHRLSRWRLFRQIEVPAAMIGLVWNSMMSMAGGWFFLTVTEAFTLKNHDYRLPGIGSYMNEAILQNDAPAMIAAVVAMTAMILFVDQVVWRPLVVWSQRFKMEEIPDAVEPRSWVIDLIRRSQRLRDLADHIAAVGHWLNSLKVRGRHRIAADLPQPAGSRAVRTFFGALMRYALLAAGLAIAGWGGWSLMRLLSDLPIIGRTQENDWLTVISALGASFLRTTVAVLLGAAWTLPAGIVIGLSPRWSGRLQPLIQVVASFPAPMLFPLATLLLAYWRVDFNFGCTFLMLLGTQWYILFNVIAGASAIPAELKEVAAVYRWGSMQRWMRLYIPCVFPHLVTGLVTAAGGAWNATIVAEYVQMQSHTYSAFGLGSIISHATARGQYSVLAAGVVTMAIAVVGINQLLWKRLYRLAERRYSLTT